MKKDTGFKIISITLLTYALLLTLVSFTPLQPDGFFTSLYLRVPISANILCLLSLFIGVFLIAKGD
ncbi:MAG: hypothetical protein Q3993_04115 [Filifactor alocis]|nr:hypothetical protein [Filifactor alocis]